MQNLTRTFLIVLLLLVLLDGRAGGMDEPYVVGRGDILSVTILSRGIVQQSIDLTVSPDGSIPFPFLGEVRVEGSTLPEITQSVTAPLDRDYFYNTQVIITVREYRSRRVYLTGAVRSPGLYALDGSTTLMQLLAKAGGLNADRTDSAYVVRGSAKEINDSTLRDVDSLKDFVQKRQSTRVDLKKLLDQGAMNEDILLEGGELIYIPSTSFVEISQYKIYVFGQVNSPGIYDYQDGLTALGACLVAGGFSQYAAPNRTTVTRPGAAEAPEVIKVNLTKVRKGQQNDVAIKPGDRIFVPESWF